MPHVYVIDNHDLQTPFRQVAVFERGRAIAMKMPVPNWLRPLLKKSDL